MTRTVTKDKAITRTTRAAIPAEQETQTNDSSAPIWKTQHNRVQGAMWEHPRAYALNLIGVRIGKEHVFEKLRIQRGIPLLARETLLGRMTL